MREQRPGEPRSTIRVERLLSRIEAWCFGSAPLHPMVVLRIALGLVLFANYTWWASDLPTLFGPDGFAGPSYTASLELDEPLNRNLLSPFYVLYHVESLAVVWVLYALLCAASLAFALGAFTRWSGSLALLLHLVFYARNPWAYWGWAVMINPFLLYAILAPSGRHFSWDACRRPANRESDDWSGPAWPLRLVQLHVCAQYLTLWPRLESDNWLQGRMLFVALVNRHYGRFPFDAFAYQDLLALLTLAALVLEIGAPILLWIPRLGPWWALGLIGMHLNIELATTVGWWNVILIAALLAFLPPAWLDRLFTRMRAIRGRPRLRHGATRTVQ